MSILYKNTTGVYIINRIKSLQFFQPRCPLHLFVGTCLFVFLLDSAIPYIITYRNLQIVQRLYTNNIDNNFIGKTEYHITTRFPFKSKRFQNYFHGFSIVFGLFIMFIWYQDFKFKSYVFTKCNRGTNYQL